MTGTFAGDTTVSPVLLASNGANNFVVTPDPTAIVYTGATTATNGSVGHPLGHPDHLRQPAARQDGHLDPRVGRLGPELQRHHQASGSASCAIASVNQSVGSVPVTASFAGDNYYLASSAAASVGRARRHRPDHA